MKDGSFIFEDKKIEFKITDNNKPPVFRGGIEKMSRYITFYYSSENLGTYSIYGEVEELTNISAEYAERKFKEYKVYGKLNTNL